MPAPRRLPLSSRAVSVLNIAAYRFVRLVEPGAWVGPLRARSEALALQGPIIVADEGINLFVAGEAEAVESFVAWLGCDALFVDADCRAAFAALDVKRSWSDAQPFARLRVKQKPEIVTMRKPSVRPALGRAPTIEPTRLATWLAHGYDDEGRPVVLLDTRNAFEFEHGSFEGAIHLDIDRFEAFPAAVEALQDELRDRTVVAFCTGGIRCEKAALYMRGIGIERVVQLDGGILRYFDAVGDAHWRGDCFVFDERRTLGVDLGRRGAGGD